MILSKILNSYRGYDFADYINSLRKQKVQITLIAKVFTSILLLILTEMQIQFQVFLSLRF